MSAADDQVAELQARLEANRVVTDALLARVAEIDGLLDDAEQHNRSRAALITALRAKTRDVPNMAGKR